MTRDLFELQEQIQDFIRNNRVNGSIPGRVRNLASAVVKVAKEVQKGTDYGSHAFVMTPKFEEELGDVLFEILCIANAADIDLAESIHWTILKMKRRIERNGRPVSSK